MSTQTELQNWLNGVVGGGPNNDGKYPLTDANGTVHLVLCPKAQAGVDEEDISIPQVFATEAQEAAVEAETSKTAAQAAAADADADRVAADGHRVAAAGSATAAAGSATTAGTHATNAGNSATAAAGSATTANTANTNAQAAKTAAETAKTASETARDLAQQWASNAEDVVVSGGLYSARHYAAKAAASALSVNAANLVTIAGNQTISGVKIFSSNAVRIDATAGQNAHLYLRDDTAINRALFYWDRATDQAVVRRYNAAGSAAEGQILISSTGITFGSPKLQADFSSGLGVRTVVQSSTANGVTNVTALPNGTGTTSIWSVCGGSDIANTNGMQFRADAGDNSIRSFKTGTGTTRPINFMFDDVTKAYISTVGNVGAKGIFVNEADNTGAHWAFLANSANGGTSYGGVWVDSAGVAFNHANFNAGVHCAGTGVVGITGNVTMQAGKSLKWGNQIQQHITLWETSTTAGSESSYGLGVQNSCLYLRSDAGIAFYQAGIHHADKFNPGSNGKMLMNLDRDSNGNATVGVGGANAGTASAMIVHRGALGTQQGHYAMAQGGARLWQLGVETDRSFKIWQYDDAGGFQSTGLTIGRGGSMRLLPTTGLHLDVGWFRSQALGTGWYHEAGAGGWFMDDTSWVKNYNGKPIKIVSNTGTVARWESVSPTFEFYDTDEGNTSWLHFNGGTHGFLQHNAFAWAAYRDSGNSWVCIGNIAAYASDGRLKTGEQPLRQFVLDRFFDNFPVEEYDWNLEAIQQLNPGFIPNAMHEVGAIAQKVEAMFKSMVVTRQSVIIDGEQHEGIKTLLWEKAVPFTIAGVQQLRRENVALKERVSTLEDQMAAVLARLAQLENAA